MSDLTAKAPARLYRNSQLRNEYTAEPSDNEHVASESIVQVPDSQAVVPETQIDLHPESSDHEFESDHRRGGRTESEQPNKADENFISRVSFKKTVAPMDSTFGGKMLAKPKEAERPTFSPFSIPRKPKRQASSNSDSHNTVKAENKPSTLALQDNAPELHAGVAADDQAVHKQVPNLSVVPADKQTLEAVQSSLVPPEIDADSTSKTVPPTVSSDVTKEKPVAEQNPAQRANPASEERSDSRTKIRKVKKGRRVKMSRPDVTAGPRHAWPPRSQTPYDSTTLKHNQATMQSPPPSEQQGKGKNVPTNGHTIQGELLKFCDTEVALEGRCDSANGYPCANPQQVLTTKLRINGMKAACEPAPNHKAASLALQPSLTLQSGTLASVEQTAHSADNRISPYIEDPDSRIHCYERPEHQAVADGAQNLRSNRIASHGPTGSPPVNSEGRRAYEPQVLFSGAAHNGDVQTQKTVISAPKECSPILKSQMHDSVLHGKSDPQNSDRISKPRPKKRCHGGPATPAAPVISDPATLPSSTDHDVILNMLAMCLRAGDTKARNIVGANAKTHEAIVASLKETIAHQKDFIQSLQQQKAHIEGKLQKMTESTVGFQKYIKGMEGDYSRLKSQAATHRDACDKIIKESSDRFEEERSALQQELSNTVETLITTQRHTRSTLDDCFNQLMLSEIKRQSTSRELEKLRIDLVEEKNKSSSLEHELLPTLQEIWDCLRDNHATMKDKLCAVQDAVYGSSTGRELNTQIKEIFDTVISLRTTPGLTTEDVRKAEGMLRFFHESLASKMNALTQFCQKSLLCAEEIKVDVQNQLATLRADLLKHEEVLKDCGNYQVLNEQLRNQLELQNEECATLTESVRKSRQEEAQTKSRHAQLQFELQSHMVQVSDHDENSARMKQEVENLRQLLEEAREALQGERNELSRVRQIYNEQGQELNSIKAVLSDREALLQEQTNNLSRESDRKDELLQKMQSEKQGLQNEMDQINVALREIASEAEKLREAKVRADNEFQKTQTIVKEAASSVLETNDLKKKLFEKSKEARFAADELTSLSKQIESLKQEVVQLSEAQLSKEEKLQKLEADYTSRVGEAVMLAQEKGQLKKQLSQHVSTISGLEEKIRFAEKMQVEDAALLRQLESETYTMRKENEQFKRDRSSLQSELSTLTKEMDDRITEHRKDRESLKELQDRLDHVQQEKNEFSARLERSSTDKVKLKEAQALHSSEKHIMQLELTELRTRLETKMKEVQKIQTEAREQSEKAAEAHAIEADELKRRVSQAENATRTAEKNSEHKSRELNAHRNATSEKFEQLVRETLNYGSHSHDMHRSPGEENIPRKLTFEAKASQRVLDPRRHEMKSFGDAAGSNNVLINEMAKKSRKKPNRLNRMVLNVTDTLPPQPQKPVEAQCATNDEHGTVKQQKEIEVAGDYITEELGAYEMLDENGVSFLDPSFGEVEPSQNALVWHMGNTGLRAKSPLHDSKPGTASSSLSDPPSSDSLIDMDALEKGTLPADAADSHVHHEIAKVVRDDEYRDTSRRPSTALDKESLRSQKRPRSQANTGSRMLPPQKQKSTALSRKERRSPIQPKTDDHHSSSPNISHADMHMRRTHGSHSIQREEHFSDQGQEMSLPAGNSLKTKRKEPDYRATDNTPSKRHQGSLRLRSSHSKASSKPAGPLPSRSHFQTESAVRTPRARKNKGTDREDDFDMMFNRELQAGRSSGMR